MFEHRWTLARGCDSGLPHGISALQDWPDFHRQPELAQTPGQALSHPAQASLRSTARHGNQHHARAKDRGESSMGGGLQPHLTGKPGQPERVGGLQARAEQSSLLADSPAAIRQVRETRSERQSRMERANASAPVPALIRKNRRRLPENRVPARPRLHPDGVRYRAQARWRLRADFPPPLPAGFAMPRRPAGESLRE